MQGLIGHLTSHEEAHGARSRDIMLQLLGGKRGGGKGVGLHDYYFKYSSCSGRGSCLL